MSDSKQNAQGLERRNHPRRWLALMSTREQLLLLVFVWALLILWIANQSGAWSGSFRTFGLAKDELSSQQYYLDSREVFIAELEEAERTVDPAKTFSSSELSETIDTYARQAGLQGKFTIDAPLTDQDDRFSVHSIRVTVRRAEISELIDFDRLLKREGPYILIAQVQLTAVPSDPRLIDARYIVSSFELDRSST